MKKRKGEVTFFSYSEKQESCMAAPLCKLLWVRGGGPGILRGELYFLIKEITIPPTSFTGP